MSAKFLHVFSDDNSDLKKQVGCMHGFFQMFERHQFLSPRLNHKRSISSGHAHSSSNSSSPITEFVLEKSHSRNHSENQRVSMESSRTSFSSSSCSSSFSSLDCNKSTQEPQHNELLDFRDVVKDSIHREARCLSIKTSTKDKDEFKKKNAFKHRDSPRPDLKSMEVSESLRVLAKLKEAHCEEEPRQSFDGKTSSKIRSVSRDSPRYSYDGRDDAKLVSKLRESPRLSLDSSTDSCKISMNRKSPKGLSFDQESSSQTRHSVVVAKLMGLEAMPYNVQEQPTSISIGFKDNVCGKKKKNKCQERKPMMMTTTTTNARIPIETAPWRQPEKLHFDKKAPFRHRPESVRSEIEKRLKELEILQSNKDLMDLKLLLDAMQVAKKTNRASESPIVVMKPMKSISKASSSPSSAVIPLEGLSRLKTPRRSETLEKKSKPLNNKTEENCLLRPPSRIQLSRKENNGNSIKTSGSVSPRLQQKKVGEETKIRRPPTPSTDLNQPQRQSPNRQPSESVSPRGKLGRKPAKKTVSNDDQSSEASTETRKAETSLRSYSNISLASSQVDIEVTSADRSSEHNRSSVNLNEDAATAAPEQPSPVSVLDASFCQVDRIQSPAKTISGSFKDSSSEINHKKLKSIEILVQKLSQLSSKDGETQTTDHIALLCDTQKPDHRYVSEILLASSLLMKDLTAMPLQLHSSGHPINPDLFLVLEQTKSQTNIIRPKNDTEKLHRKLIFDLVNEVLVQKLELTSPYIKTRKLSIILPTGQRLLRQVCSEIDQLQNESSEGGNSDDDEHNSASGEQVLRNSVEWQHFGSEMQELVLEIERSIFKELIDDVVCCEIDAAAAAASLQTKNQRKRKQLFAK